MAHILIRFLKISSKIETLLNQGVGEIRETANLINPPNIFQETLFETNTNFGENRCEEGEMCTLDLTKIDLFFKIPLKQPILTIGFMDPALPRFGKD
jgi:hypothetical protein